MPVVEPSIVVNALIDKVFALQDDPWKSSASTDIRPREARA